MAGKDPDASTRKLRLALTYVDSVYDDPALDRTAKIAKLRVSPHWSKLAAYPELTSAEKDQALARLKTYTDLAIRGLASHLPAAEQSEAKTPIRLAPSGQEVPSTATP